ncbi:hypothetical protein [Novosphingobium sp. JCM 18896]|uniref:hypothetical protein n=1 Tax=Novosphingobium sp. JCM 18896 TaxID=2989731 RepID=UPI0022232A45|nr:hypothetical protein [Novosphingobium sp. JCM 18896]MCW1432108.1 hypothetical protein [Novosphingobium sp. JCM 18896]
MNNHHFLFYFKQAVMCDRAAKEADSAEERQHFLRGRDAWLVLGYASARFQIAATR